MISSNFIITFGLTESQNQVIRSHLKNTKSELINADSCVELITSNYFVSIINQKKLKDNDIKSLITFYSEIDGKLSKTIILTENTTALSTVSNATVFQNFNDLQNNINIIIKKAYRKIKNAENNATTLSYAIMILSQIRNHPYITTYELSQKINRKPPVVQRYIEILRIAGESIEYDKKAKGWKLKNRKSILMGDIDE